MLHWTFFQKLWVNKSSLRHILHPIFPKTSFPKFLLSFFQKKKCKKAFVKKNHIFSFQIYWVAPGCVIESIANVETVDIDIICTTQCGNSRYWYYRASDITSAMSVIKNCDDWYPTTKTQNHKNTESQKSNHKRDLCFLCSDNSCVKWWI